MMTREKSELVDIDIYFDYGHWYVLHGENTFNILLTDDGLFGVHWQSLMSDDNVEAHWKYIHGVLFESCLEYEDVGWIVRFAWEYNVKMKIVRFWWYNISILKKILNIFESMWIMTQICYIF